VAQLGDVLDQRCESVAADAFGGFVPITVHLDGRISVRKRETAFKGQMFAARPGDVVFSKIDARNGAIGVLPPTIPDAVVTPEFPIFTPKRTAISARYLELVLRAGGFIEALRRRATGTSGRKRITPESFRSLSIPLPPLVEQQALVAAHDLALAEAHALELQATEAEQAGARAFCDALGVAAPPPLPWESTKITVRS
jgi:type I restriction enzyme S subunit